MAEYLYIYVVARDFGFAPNPFHGVCTFATCKPKIRGTAKVNDWVMGVGGSRLNATGKCIYLMKVSETITFNEYWTDDRFRRKKPLRNGSRIMMVGDNVYHQNAGSNNWIQGDSHHSNSDGSPNLENLKRDTSNTKVLISNHFYYFGKNAPDVDLAMIGYKNHIGHSKKPLSEVAVTAFIEDIEREYRREKNLVQAYPFDFKEATKRVDQASGKIS
jgi:hypothetical protein